MIEELYRLEPLSYTVNDNEIDVELPISTVHSQWIKPRWDRDKQKWVEEGTPNPITLIQQDISTLDIEINRNMSNVVAHLYDVINALVKTVSPTTRDEIEKELSPTLSSMTEDEFLTVQVEAEPSATGRSAWREMVDHRNALQEKLSKREMSAE